MIKEKIVMPGEIIGNSIEFLPGINTFEDENGNIFANKIGLLEVDEEERKLKVKTLARKLKPITKGAIVIGQVFLLKDNMALISIMKAFKGNTDMVCHETIGTLTIARTSLDFLKSMEDAMRIGDIVKAEVFAVEKYSIELTTQKPELGVIKAFSIQTREPMYLKGNILKTLHGITEKRKVSTEYLLR